MCGIAGSVRMKPGPGPDEDGLRRMLAMIRHRGPDQFGMFLDEDAALGSARLSIIDLAGGQQPISNEDGRYWIVFNGEIFNYPELRRDLLQRGHHFTTESDTEVLLHLFEEFGADCLGQLNGQFAFAIWDRKTKSLFLARDRLGIRPLFYTQTSNALLFGSEIKALLVHPEVTAELDPAVLDQVFTFWSALTPKTIFRNILELPPGHFLRTRGDRIEIKRYWQVDFPAAGDRPMPRPSAAETEAYADAFRALLVDATRMRLRADVPVGAYLSGGLDSSAIASVIRHETDSRLTTFSIAFEDPQFDESAWQLQMAEALGTDHQVLRASHADIGRVFPDVVWHAETPLLRTSPAPMFLLSKLVQDSRFKVVLTGEGADEFLAGYDLFKEAKIRRFWARDPSSRLRPQLLTRLYADIKGLAKGNAAMLAAFFRGDLAEVDSPWYSHMVRWRNTRRLRRFLSPETNGVSARGWEELAGDVPLPPGFGGWGPLEKAQYLEISVFLSPYLLSSQGDRMTTAHSIEGRYPFLDHRMVEFCNRLPASLKLRGLNEKFLLKHATRQWLPEAILKRPKRPYRAPIHRSFFHDEAPEYVRELLSAASLRECGLFDPAPVRRLVDKVDAGGTLSETDDMALAGLLSTQLLHWSFVKQFQAPPPLKDSDDVRICRPAD